MTGMAKPPQFSLQYLFLEVFWVASALGCATQAFRMESSNLDVMRGLLALYAVLCSGAAIGGLFHKMTTGFLITAGLIGVGAVAMMLLAVLAFLGVLPS